MYSYDVASPSRPSASRSIPSMRPSYDAEHPSSATPIYDALYSEYRRLFRALPGDRSDEENMRFTGFAVREPASTRHELMPYPQHQTFHTFAGQAGIPQFMPSQQSGAGQFGLGPGHGSGGGSTGANNGSAALGQGLAAGAGQYATTGPATGQGWVAAGYLAPPQPTDPHRRYGCRSRCGGQPGHRRPTPLDALAAPGRGPAQS